MESSISQLTSMETVPQREADLVPLRVAIQHARDPAEVAVAEAKLDAELSRRRRINQIIRRAVSDVLRSEAVVDLFQVCVKPSIVRCLPGLDALIRTKYHTSMMRCRPNF